MMNKNSLKIPDSIRNATIATLNKRIRAYETKIKRLYEERDRLILKDHLTLN